MLVRLPAVTFLLALFLRTPSSVSAAAKHGTVPPSQCATVFERFGHIRVPADAKAASRVLGDIRWLSRAVVYEQTVLAGWIPISHHLGRPGGVFVIELTPSVSQRNAGYRIYAHITSASADDPVRSFRAFLAKNAPPDVQLDECALFYPDTHILHIEPNSRKRIPPIF
jgi:hypothetical protein